jgi:hypothetical protein
MKMPLDMIRVASAQHFEDARADAPNISETTPPIITNEVRDFAASLAKGAPVYVPVIEDHHGLFGWCSDGVGSKIAADGGTFAYGWTIWEWPGVLLTAEFHAVWCDDAGNFFDITPKPGGETRILFLHDPTFAQDFDFDNRPRNRRVRLHQTADPAPAVAEARAKLAGPKLAYEQKRAEKAGMTLDEHLKHKLPRDSLADAIDEVIKTCDGFEEYYDSLARSGPVQPDQRLAALAQRRERAQSEMKKLLKKTQALAVTR